jgi:hypothetical protein
MQKTNTLELLPTVIIELGVKKGDVMIGRPVGNLKMPIFTRILLILRHEI